MKHVTVEQVSNGFVVTLHVAPQNYSDSPSIPHRMIVPAEKIVDVLSAFLTEGGTIYKAAEIIKA